MAKISPWASPRKLTSTVYFNFLHFFYNSLNIHLILHLVNEISQSFSASDCSTSPFIEHLGEGSNRLAVLACVFGLKSNFTKKIDCQDLYFNHYSLLDSFFFRVFVFLIGRLICIKLNWRESEIVFFRFSLSIFIVCRMRKNQASFKCLWEDKP